MTNTILTHFRLPKELLLAAQETARQHCQSVSAVLRRSLEAYVALEALKQAQNPE